MSVSALQAFVRAADWLATEHARWPWHGAELALQVQYYLTQTLPPDEFISSVRGILLRDSQVLVVQNVQGQRHVIPGGRREPGETLLQTLTRELGEETGWTFTSERLLGVMHFRHLNPCPADYPYPFPEFIQLVYALSAKSQHPALRLADDHELHSEFRDIDDALQLALPEGQKRFLSAIQQR